VKLHQSIELGVFNSLETGVKKAPKSLHKAGLLTKPTSLGDWEQHARYWVLLFGAYFEAFYPPDQQYVGGGVDVVSIAWPP
jgi:hypothetical protein